MRSHDPSLRVGTTSTLIPVNGDHRLDAGRSSQPPENAHIDCALIQCRATRRHIRHRLAVLRAEIGIVHVSPQSPRASPAHEPRPGLQDLLRVSEAAPRLPGHQRSNRGPSLAPASVHRAMVPTYQSATKGTLSSVQWSA